MCVHLLSRTTQKLASYLYMIVKCVTNSYRYRVTALTRVDSSGGTINNAIFVYFNASFDCYQDKDDDRDKRSSDRKSASRERGSRDRDDGGGSGRDRDKRDGSARSRDRSKRVTKWKTPSIALDSLQ